jgi:PST family polysaccharide transporter
MDSRIPFTDFRRHVLSGTVWSAGGQGITAALRFGIMLVLARLLPADLFGLLGMSLVVMLLLRDISDMGLGAALVQRETVDELDMATIFWFNLGVSLLMAMLLLVGSDPVAQLLGDARLVPVLRTLSFLLPVNALSMVPQAVMRRELRFAQLAWRDIAGMIGFGLVGIPLALLEMGIWSLVAALTAQWLARSALLWLASPYRPSLRFSRTRLISLSGFSIWMFVGMLMSRLMANIDYFLIGRFLGATALGYYTLAFQLVIVPNQRISGILSWVLFPSFSIIQNDIERVRSGFLETLRYIALALVPISTFLFVSSDALIPFLYSSKWEPAIPVVRWLALASFFYGLDIMHSLINAVGQPIWRAWILGLRAAAFVALCWSFGLDRGIEGVALSILVAVALSALLQIWVLGHKLLIGPIEIWRSVRLPLLGALPVIIVIWALAEYLEAQGNQIELLTIVALILLDYGILVAVGYRRDMSRLFRISGLARTLSIKRPRSGDECGHVSK